MENIASAINSALHDPMVHSELATFGYAGDEAREEFRREIRSSRRQLEKIKQNPVHPHDKAAWAMRYIGRVLDHENAPDSENDSFESWFAARFPEVTREGKELLGIFHEIGFDTPETMRLCMLQVVVRYGLQSVVY